MSIGFTGTQRGMAPAQRARFVETLHLWAPHRAPFHHGDCIGADAEAHASAQMLGYHIVLHPPLARSRRAWCAADEVRPEAPYLVRNQHIVDECRVLIATPGEFTEQLRSGTWSTVRRARRAQRSVMIIYPDGSLALERWTEGGSAPAH